MAVKSITSMNRTGIIPSGFPSDNAHELIHLQTSPPDKGTIDVRLGQQAGRVVGLDTPPVLDANRLGDLPIVTFCHDVAKVEVNFFRLLRRGILARADRPHRLVGDHDLPKLLGGQAGERALELAANDPHGLLRLPLGQRFTEADDGSQPGLQGRVDLVVDLGVGLAEDVAAFAVAEDHVSAAEILQHRRRSLPP